MIKLFVSDIDGCLAMPYRPYDLARFQALAEHAAAAAEPGAVDVRPAVSLCSGRSYSYVEAMAQVLGLTTPVLFESGGGMFDPASARTTWHPAFTPEVEAQVQEVRTWMLETLCRPDTSLSLDFNKRTQAGLVSPKVEEIEAHIPEVEAFVAETAPELHVFSTHVSIDVLAPGITKKEAMQWISRHLSVPLEEMAYIGDTGGDLAALEEVGVSFAPANAEALVRERVDVVTESPVLAGTLEAYAWCMQHNEAHVAQAS